MRRLLIRNLLIYLSLLQLLTSCGAMDASIENVDSRSKPVMELIGDPASISYIKDTTYNFTWTSAAVDAKYIVKVYSQAQCQGTATVTVNDVAALQYSATGLLDGQVYSVGVSAKNNLGTSSEVCTPAVGIDTQAPAAISFINPSADLATGSGNYTFSWSGLDNGISGLASDNTYQIDVFDNGTCSGSTVSSVTQSLSTYNYASFVASNIYSVRIKSFDKAGNSSTATCSHSVTYSPGSAILALADTVSASTQYTKNVAVNVSITNDAAAAKWCISETQTAAPANVAAACTGGNGATNGWHTVKPTTFTLSAGDNTKTVYLWVADGAGGISGTAVSSAILLDTTSPVLGSWLAPSAVVNQTTASYLFQWNPAAEAGSGLVTTNAYQVETFANGTCTGVPISSSVQTNNDFNYTGFTDGVYSIRLHATDKAGNTSLGGCSFAVNVDNAIPVANVINGVSGTSDLSPDQWLTGSVYPNVSWNSFTSASSYDVTIKDGTGTTVVCPTVNTSAINYLFSSCALTDGQNYQVFVSGKSPSGLNAVPASNDAYSFTVDSQTPAAFSITGITGGSDTNPDGWLIDTVLNTLTPTITWTASAGADYYDLVVKDISDTTTVCSELNVVTNSSTPIACVLLDGSSYRVHVTAKHNSGPGFTIASNDSSFTFRIDNTFPAAFNITGVTGGSDVTADAWLSGGTTAPTITWGASAGAVTYDVVVKNLADTVNQCFAFGVAATSVSPASCNLLTGSTYRVHVTAKSSSGFNNTTAANTSTFTFTVDSIVPGAFAIAGVTGGSDVTADQWLVNTTNPTVTFGSSGSSSGYDIEIKDNAGVTTLCSMLNQPSSPVSLGGCGLINGTSYRLFVSAKNSSGFTSTPATNDNFVFTVDTTMPTTNTILGVKGASDIINDAWLILGINPILNWNAFVGASSYDVVIKDNAGSSVVCALVNTATNTYDFSSCNLSDGVAYKAYVTGKSLSGFNTVTASNQPYSFTVDSQQPATFSITGVSGGTDSTADSWMTDSVNPVVAFGASVGAATYDVVIKNSLDTVTICSNLAAVAPPVTVTGCALANNGSYRIHVTSKSLSGQSTFIASNDSFSFTVDTNIPAAFSITGVSGTTDLTVDTVLANGDIDPKINWGASANASNYDVVITNAADSITMCSAVAVVASPKAMTGCSLIDGNTYHVHVTAKSVSGLHTNLATNDATFTFQVDGSLPQPFAIGGVTGGSDVTSDAWLNNGVNPTIGWGTSTNAASYTVVLKDSSDTTTLCTQPGISGTTVSLTTCGLVNGTTYRIHISALSTSGANQVIASNDGITFRIDSLPPSAFAITGITGSGDLLVDTWLAGGALDPIVNFAASTNAATYDIVIKDTTDTTTLCTRTGATSSPATINACGLTNGQNVHVHVTAISASGVFSTPASNDATFTFDVDTSIPGAFNISGVSGLSDVLLDGWLIDGSDPTITWTSSSGAMDYDVYIKNNADSVTLCTFLAVPATSLVTTGCGLANGTIYKIHVFANPFSGPLKTAATNDPFTFQIDNTDPGAFSISGITGGTDAIVDTWLSNGFNPSVNWSASALASSYLVEIKDTTDSFSQCTATSSTSPASPISCGLSNNTNYKVHVTAKTPSGYHSVTATNDATFNFNVDSGTMGAFSITGVTGVGDAVTDVWLIGGTDPEINWGASSGASKYDIVIRNQADSATLCTVTDSAGSPATLTGCGLVNGTVYRAKVTAKSISGINTLAAANNASYQFTVDTTIPGAFDITGVSGGTDAIADVWLTNGINPTIAWSASAGAASYVVTIKNSTDTFTQCSATVVGSPASISSCGLANGVSYHVHITARSPSTQNTTLATSDATFTFQLDNTVPGAFNISGAIGNLDVIADQWLIGTLTPSISFTGSSSAATYNISIKDSSDVTTMCTLNGAVSSPAAVTGCTLTHGLVYHAHVTAFTVSGLLSNAATNTSTFTFTVDNTTPGAFNITGITGESSTGDTIVDAFLATTGSLIPVISWSNSLYGATFDIIIKDDTDVVVKCSATGVLASPYDFTTCTTLAAFQTYHVHIRAKSLSGFTFTDATNDATFTFVTDGSKPAAFNYRGITSAGAGDNTQDSFLSAGLNPRVNWDNNVANAYYFDVFIHDSTGTILKCSKTDVDWWQNNYAFTGGVCGLTVGPYYKVTVIAKSFSGQNTTLGTYTTPITSYLFTIDNVAPLVSYSITPSLSPNSSATQTISGTCSDSGSGIAANGIKICIKNSNDGTCAFPADYINTTNCSGGVYSYTASMTPETWEIEVVATDAAGNTGLIFGQGGQNYDVVAAVNDWVATGTGANLPSARQFASSVYTGTKMIVWGGKAAGTAVNTGGVLDASANTWTATDVGGGSVPSARSNHTAVWTGTKMLVWGGKDVSSAELDNGAAYDLAGNSWTTLASGSAPSARAFHTAVWTGTKMIIWGGDASGVSTNTGAVYDPAGDTWTPMAVLNAPSARSHHTAVWTGTVMIVWGGDNGGTSVNTGATYNPSTDTWTAIDAAGGNVPSARSYHTAVWTGTKMLIWGGVDGVTKTNTGSVYTLAGNSWAAMDAGSAPTARANHVAVWTDNRMIVWGGSDGGGLSNTGGVYKLSTDTWTSTDTTSGNLPSARSEMTAVWAANLFKLIVWGGSDGSDSNTGGMYAP